MTGFNHGLAGAIIALTVKQPLLAIPIAFASHYILDMLPHLGFSQDRVLEQKFNRFVKTDFAASVLLMIVMAILFPDDIAIIWTCMIASALPDIVWFFHRKTVKKWPKELDRFTSFHWHINNHVKNFYFDATYSVLMILVILIIRF